MKQILRLALRNLTQHKSKTIIISAFLIFGIAVVIMGNSFLESINRGLEKDFRQNYTGDIAIGTKPKKGETNDIFGVNTVNFTGEIPQLPAIDKLDTVCSIVNETEGISKKTKLISAQVIVGSGFEFDLSSLSEKDDLGFDDIPISMLMAGEDETFWDTFDNIHFTEGTFPAKDSNEIIVDTRVKKAYESLFDKQLNIGDTVLVLGNNTKGIIREGKVSGFFKPSNEYSAMFQVIYANPSFVRSFADLTYASSFIQELPDTVDLSLSDLSEEDMFGGSDDFFAEIDEIDDTYLATSSTNFDDILGDTSLRDQLNQTDDGAWHYILMKVKNPLKTKAIIKELNARFESEGLNVHAMDWKEAAFSYSESVGIIGIVFNTLIIILSIVVFIIIMNTMMVSIIERTGEIGTMRAIGAEKRFINLLFFSESGILTLLSAFIGMIIAFVIMIIFNSLHITITNSIAKMILGGGLLHFSPTFTIIGVTFLVAFLGSILSNIYPVRSALKITPLKALSKE